MPAESWKERFNRLGAAIQDPDPGVRRDGLAELIELYGVLTEALEAGPPASERAEAASVLIATCSTLALYPDGSLPLELGGDDFLAQGLEVATRCNLQTEGAGLALQLSNRMRGRGELTLADGVLRDALVAFPDAELPAPWIHVARAEIAREQRDVPRALSCLDRATDSLRDVPEHGESRVRIAGTRAEVLLLQGLLGLAAAEVAETTRLAGDRPDLALTALLYRLQYDMAVENFEGILARVEAVPADGVRSPSQRLRLALFEGIARSELAREGRGSAEEAYRALQGALELSPESEARTTLELALADLDLRTGRIEDGSARLENAAQSIAESAREAQPQHLADLAALRSQLAFLQGAEPKTPPGRGGDLERAFRALIENWSSIPTSPGGIGFLHYGSRRRVVSELVRTSMALGHPEEALQWLLEAQQQSTLVRRLDAPPVDLATVRRTLLDDDTGILAYLPALDRSHVFAVDREAVLHAELCALDGIKGLNQELQATLFRLPGESEGARAARRVEITRLGSALADELLPDPIRRRASRWKHVIVCGEELLGHVPFEALSLRPDDPAAGAPALLGTEWALTLLPSIPLGCFLEGRRRFAGETERELECILVAAPETRSARDRGEGTAPDDRIARARRALPPLPLGEADRERLLAPFDPERVRVLSGAGATSRALAAAPLARTPMLEFLTHSVEDPRRARPAGLVLAAGEDHDGVLWCEAVEQLAAPPLVVLLSCATARAPLRQGDASANELGGAFLFGGARCVVGSRAPLAFRAAVDLGGAFHHSLVQGAAPAEALRQARNALAQEPSTGDPFYFATIQVIGLGHRPLD